jgi:putative toxin of predicted polymorphic toxin system
MAVSTQLKQYAGRRITRRLMRSMPWLGGIIALATFGQAIREKGVIGGTVDTAIDFIPFVGGVKNLVEAARGRDFIPTRRLPEPAGDLSAPLPRFRA